MAHVRRSSVRNDRFVALRRALVPVTSDSCCKAHHQCRKNIPEDLCFGLTLIQLSGIISRRTFVVVFGLRKQSSAGLYFPASCMKPCVTAEQTQLDLARSRLQVVPVCFNKASCKRMQAFKLFVLLVLRLRLPCRSFRFYSRCHAPAFFASLHLSPFSCNNPMDFSFLFTPFDQ